jgi:hypothetical protein
MTGVRKRQRLLLCICLARDGSRGVSSRAQFSKLNTQEALEKAFVHGSIEFGWGLVREGVGGAGGGGRGTMQEV